MLTGVFKGRTQSRADVALSAQQALAELLQSKVLRSHPLRRQCEIGPFIVDYVFCERSLIVELQPCAGAGGEGRHEARTAFLNEMGYTVVCVSPRELISRPTRVLAQIEAAMK